jgi:hypothetical protein
MTLQEGRELEFLCCLKPTQLKMGCSHEKVFNFFWMHQREEGPCMAIGNLLEDDFDITIWNHMQHNDTWTVLPDENVIVELGTRFRESNHIILNLAPSMSIAGTF